MKRLIVNADDFGHAPGVNQGILDAHHNGLVTSTTVLVNYPDAAPGLERAKTEAPDLGIGLHLNLTSGKPVSPPAHIPSLVDDQGNFYAPAAWAEQFEHIQAEHVEREIGAQMDRFIELTGHAPDHLDSHHHITYFQPDGLRMMLDLSAQFNIPMRNTRLDQPDEDAVRSLMGMVRGLPEPFAWSLIEQLNAIVATVENPFWPARFDMSFYGDHATLGHLLVILTNLPDDSVTEIMCHPGYPDAGLVDSSYIEGRATEIAHLTHAATLECVESEGITLITFGDLAR